MFLQIANIISCSPIILYFALPTCKLTEIKVSNIVYCMVMIKFSRTKKKNAGPQFHERVPNIIWNWGPQGPQNIRKLGTQGPQLHMKMGTWGLHFGGSSFHLTPGRNQTLFQRSKELRKRRERDHARCAAQTASERQATSQQRSTHERERLAVETPEGKKIIADKNQPARKFGSWNSKEKDYSGWTSTSTKGWQLKPLRRENTQFCVNYSGTDKPVNYSATWNVWCKLF